MNYELLPSVYMERCNVMPFLGAVFAVTPGTLLDHMLYISILNDPVYWLPCEDVFSIPVWLLCSWPSMCVCNKKGMIIHLSFIATPSITATSCLFGQNPRRVGSKSSLFCIQPLIMYVCSVFSSASILIAFLISSTDVHTRTSVTMLSVYVDVRYFLIFTFSLIVTG